MKKQTFINIDTKRTVGIGVFSALAYIVMLIIKVPIQFLTFDAKDAIICIASFLYGPLSSAIISFIVAFIEFVTVSDTGIYGFFMNFLSSFAFSFTASIIYSKKKTMNGAIISLSSAVIATVGVMMLFNLLITPLYLGVETSVVAGMLPDLLLPFNLAKSLMNAALVIILYKPIVKAMRRAKLIEGGTSNEAYFNKKSIITLIIGIVAITVSVIIFVVLANK